VRGKGEMLELLQLEKKGWQNLVKLKTRKETDQQFQKTVKKRLDYVPVVTEPVVPSADEEEEDEEPELVELDDSDDEATAVEDVTLPLAADVDMKELSPTKEEDIIIPLEEKDDSSVEDISEEPISIEVVPSKTVTTELDKAAVKETINGSEGDNEKSEKKKKPKAGPRSKVKRARSPSPEGDADCEDIASKKGKTDPKIVNDPREATRKSVVLEEKKPAIVFDANTTDEGLETIGTLNNDNEYGKADEDRRVLVFNVEGSSTLEECCDYFKSFPNFEHAQRAQKGQEVFKGVYLVSFITKQAAQEFIRKDTVFKERKLEKVELGEYNREHYFLRQIQRCEQVENNYQKILVQMKAEKKVGREAHCAHVRILSSDVTDEEVQEYYCGITSDFIERFGNPAEEAIRVKDDEKQKFPDYLLIFETDVDAKKFTENDEFAKFDKDIPMKVLLLTDNIKRIRFSKKAKNFPEKITDNQRSVALQTVNSGLDKAKVEDFINETFTGLETLTRCQINGFCWGLYILTFKTSEDAVTATKTEVDNEHFVSNPQLTLLPEYLRLRQKFLDQKPEERARNSFGSWDSKENSEGMKVSPTERKEAVEKVERGKVSFDNIVGCKGFGQTSLDLVRGYFRDNHENVEQVICFRERFVRFKDAESTKRFSTLNYIRHLGNPIELFSVDQFYRELDETDQQNMLGMLNLS